MRTIRIPELARCRLQPPTLQTKMIKIPRFIVCLRYCPFNDNIIATEFTHRTYDCSVSVSFNFQECVLLCTLLVGVMWYTSSISSNSSTFLGHMFRLYRQLSLIRKCYFYVWHVRLIYALNYYLLTYLLTYLCDRNLNVCILEQQTV